MPPLTPGAPTPPKQEVPPHPAQLKSKVKVEQSALHSLGPSCHPFMDCWGLLGAVKVSSASLQGCSSKHNGLWGWIPAQWSLGLESGSCQFLSLPLACPSTTYSLMVELGMAVSEISGSFSGQAPAPARGRNFNSEMKNLALGTERKAAEDVCKGLRGDRCPSVKGQQEAGLSQLGGGSYRRLPRSPIRRKFDHIVLLFVLF